MYLVLAVEQMPQAWTIPSDYDRIGKSQVDLAQSDLQL